MVGTYSYESLRWGLLESRGLTKFQLPYPGVRYIIRSWACNECQEWAEAWDKYKLPKSHCFESPIGLNDAILKGETEEARNPNNYTPTKLVEDLSMIIMSVQARPGALRSEPKEDET
jgi:hypothetical protein